MNNLTASVADDTAELEPRGQQWNLEEKNSVF